MRRSVLLVCLLLIALSAMLSGCTRPQSAAGTTPVTTLPAATAAVPATLNTVALPVVTDTAAPVAFVTPETTVFAAPSPVPAADPEDISRITFSRYTGNDFSIDYPSAWTVAESVYTPYYCKNDVDVANEYYRICYQDEMKTIGPFNFYEGQNNFKSPSRIVTMTSADGRLKFVAYTQEFLANLDGTITVYPSYDLVKNDFHKMYPDLYSLNYVANYREFRAGNANALSYDMILPAGHDPSAYTEEILVTVHHLYRFAFITDTDSFSRYRNLNDRMLTSIATNDS